MCISLQSPEHNRSLDDLEEEANHVVEPLEAAQEFQEEAQGPLKIIRHGGEDGETGGTMSQRQRLNADMPDGSLVRRGQGEVTLAAESWKSHRNVLAKMCRNLADYYLLAFVTLQENVTEII